MISDHHNNGRPRGLRRATILFALVVLLVWSQWPSPAAAHGTGKGVAVQGEWVGLEQDDALRSAGGPWLQVRLTSKERLPRQAILAVTVSVDDTHKRTRYRAVSLPAGGSASKWLRLPLHAFHLRQQRYSGRIELAVFLQRAGDGDTDSQHAGENFAMPTLWFHLDGERFVFYRDKVMRERYAGGNFSNRELKVPDFSEALRRAVGQTGLPRNQLLLDHIAQRPSRPGQTDDFVPPGSRKFCLVMNGIAFNDSSRPGIDFGEDFGRSGDLIPLSRGWVAIGQGGAPLFTGFLDEDGCSNYVISSPNQEVSIAFSPIYLNTGPGIRGFVSSMVLGDSWPDSMPFYLFFFEPVDAPVNYVEMDEDDKVHTMFTAAANCMERAPGGIGEVLYEFRLGPNNDNLGTFATYAAEGHPMVYVKNSGAAASKFTLCHEYAHAMGIAKLEPPITPDDLDYSVEADEPEFNHTVDSKEWNLTAAFEGFAHFIAATVWNEAAADGDGVFVNGGNIYPGNNTSYPLDVFDQRFIDLYGIAGNPGQGVELDWAQFFWAWHTRTFPGSLLIPAPVMVDIWYAAYPWPDNEGFYDAFQGAATGILNGYVPAIPLVTKQAQMDTWRAAAGVVP